MQKETFLSAFEKQVESDAKMSVMEDMVCFDRQGCDLVATDLPAPFRAVGQPSNATMQIVPDLSVAQALKAARNANKAMSPEVLAASMLGHRLTTLLYVTKVAEWIRDRNSGKNVCHAHALPPSIKFQSCCTAKPVHVLLDEVWLREFGNTISCLKRAANMKTSKWTLYTYEQRPQWQGRSKTDMKLTRATQNGQWSSQSQATYCHSINWCDVTLL